MQLKDQPEYKIAFSHNGINLYMPCDVTNYHKSREVAMSAQDKYSNAGITKNVLQDIATRAIEICNKQLNSDTFRTDMGILWNNLLARTKEPVDELCAIRMGAIACFMEEENPNEVNDFWTRKKIELANTYSEFYTFFLNMGIAFIPEYYKLCRTINLEDYLNSREQMLISLTPITINQK